MSAPRIIAGRYHGRRLEVPKGDAVRPTAARMREALFNILRHGRPSLEGAAFLDLFAGTGAVGLEALSQGARRVLMVEQEPAIARMAERNLRHLGAGGEARVMCSDATRLGRAPERFDLVYLDPPYGKNLVGPALTSLVEGGWLARDVLLVAELAAGEPLELPSVFAVARERRYGAGRLVLLQRDCDTAAGRSNAAV